MAEVEVTLPRMLARLVDGSRVVTVDARTVFGAIEAVVELHPELRVHIFDEAGEVREHIACFHNGSAISRDHAVAPDDRVTVLQAVSGG